jgi:hypothetical protein
VRVELVDHDFGVATDPLCRNGPPDDEVRADRREIAGVSVMSSRTSTSR